MTGGYGWLEVVDDWRLWKTGGLWMTGGYGWLEVVNDWRLWMTEGYGWLDVLDDWRLCTRMARGCWWMEILGDMGIRGKGRKEKRKKREISYKRIIPQPVHLIKLIPLPSPCPHPLVPPSTPLVSILWPFSYIIQYAVYIMFVHYLAALLLTLHTL